MADGSRTPSPRESWLRPNLAAFPSPPAGSPRVDSATAVAEAAADAAAAAAGGGSPRSPPPPDAAAGALRPYRDRTPSSRELAAFPEPPPLPPVLAAVTPARDAYAGAVPTAMVALPTAMASPATPPPRRARNTPSPATPTPLARSRTHSGDRSATPTALVRSRTASGERSPRLMGLQI